MISLIWAMDENRVIGLNNELPWHIPAELKYFKKTTMGHPIAMGRKTWDSIGRPLPGRENIIITRNESFSCEGCRVMNSLKDLVAYSQESNQEVFVIGGAEIFKSILPETDRLYLTRIHAEFEGDTFFPEVDFSKWILISSEKGQKDEHNPYDYQYEVYERK